MPILFIDPNNYLNGPTGNDQLNQDDLTISVQLSTEPKSRSVIVSSNEYSKLTNVNNGQTIYFIEGNETGNGKFLTTNYNNYKSDNKTSAYDFNNTIEGFGITNIDISFNTSYAPIIKINFIDVRGGVLSRGNTSKYRVFFDLPYPIFKLTVKGYYGKAVTYCLHMVKWNALFNSDTGNFEISAEFIGYTYAMLTDALTGIMRAVPYTRIGKSVFESISKKYYKNGEYELITIDKMLKEIDTFNETLDEFKQSEEYNKILEINKKYTAISDIKSSINKFINSSSSLNKKTISDGDTFISIMDGDLNDSDIKEFNNSISNNIKKLNIKNLSEPYYILSKKVDPQKFNKVPTNQTTEAINELIDKSSNKYDKDADKDRLYDFVLTLSNRYNIQQYPGSFNICDFYKLCKAINDEISKLETEEDETKRKLSEKLRNNFRNTAKFDPYIGNIYKTLIAHIEILFKTICMVSNNAENNVNRNNILLKLAGESTSYYDVKGDTIYAWPTYYTNDTKMNSVTESWLGDSVSINDVDELSFIEELLSVMLDQKKKDIELNNFLSTSNRWNPISPLDTPINGIIRNPYLSADGKNKTVIYPETLMRFLMFRMYYYFFINKNTLSDLSSDFISKFEAMNMFYSISDDKLKDVMMDMIKSSDDIIQFFENPTVPGKEENDTPYMVKSGDTYYYSYISGSTGNETTKYQYIPIHTTEQITFDSRNFVINGRLNKELIDRTTYITNRFSENEDAKFIKIISPEEFNSNNFVNILSMDEELEQKYNDKFGDGSNTYPTIDAVSNSYSIFGGDNKLPSYKSPYISNQFNVPTFRILDSEDGTSVASQFFVNTKKGFGLTTIKNSIDDDIEYDNIGLFNKLYKSDNKDNIFPGEVTYGFINNENIVDGLNVVSLFGSPLYYGQNGIYDTYERDLAKAYLFINTLPLRGIFGKIVKGDSGFFTNSTIFGNNRLEQNDKEFNTRFISSLFSSNASFIELPESWIIWIGSILWRQSKNTDPIMFLGTFNNQPTPLIPGISESFLPNKNQLLHSSTYQSIDVISEDIKPPMFFTNNIGLIQSTYNTEYNHVDDTLINLPNRIKKIFIDKFTSWATDYENIYGFGTIKNQLEISKLNQLSIPQGGMVEFNQWQTFAQLKLTNESVNGTQFSEFTNKNYSGVTVMFRGDVTDLNTNNFSYDVYVSDAASQPMSLKDFRLKTNYEEKTIQGLLTLFSKTSILCNNNPALWSRFINKENAADIKIVSNNFFYPISIKENDMKKYLNGFVNQFKAIYDKEKKSKSTNDELKEDIFQTKDNSNIKLQLYKHISAINNKWVAGNHKGFYPCSASDYDNCEYSIFETFEFVNKAFQDISNEFPINTDSVSKMLRSNWNQSFYDFSSRLLADNNFNFIALPNRIAYSDSKDMSQLFRTYSYNHMISDKNSSEDVVYGGTGPRFICMYAGQPSTSLNIGGNNFPDDAINFDNDGNPVTSEGKSTNGWYSDTYSIPVFKVDYGQGNQNIFKTVRLDQSEFTETLESLTIIDDMSKNGAYNKNATKIGQNLFNTYQTRSYSAEIEALGMPMIQPMMYFQLNDIPIFKGGYLIISTSHNIKPNHMTTKFKGVRQRAAFTPIIDDFYAMRALDLGNSQKPTKISIIKNTIKNDSPDKIKPNEQQSPVINKNDSTRVQDGFNIYDYNFKNSVKSYRFSNDMFNRPSNTKKNGVYMTYNDIFNEISSKLGIPTIVLKTTSVVESTVGNAKSVKEGKPNDFGYVGLMQFGRPAAVDVEKQLNDYIKNDITSSQYSFYSSLFDFNGVKKLKLIPQSDWTSDSSTNNENNNIFFDDYISTLSMALYAIRYMNTEPKNIKNIIDVYLTHQQGPSGLKIIKANPTNVLSDGSSTSTNMLNNRPLPTNDTSKYPTYLDWYLGWAGKIDGISKEIDPEYESPIEGVDNTTPNADKLRKVLKDLGYKEKGSEISSSGDIELGISDASIAIFRKIKQTLPDITIEVTAGNDSYHQSSQSSNHKKGQSIDFIIYKSNGDKIKYISGWNTNPIYSSYDKSIIESVLNILLGYVFGNNPKFRILNEYTNPSPKASGPHFHMTWRDDGSSNEGESYITMAIDKYNSGLIESYAL